jgi:hypothetical protein
MVLWFLYAYDHLSSAENPLLFRNVRNRISYRTMVSFGSLSLLGPLRASHDRRGKACGITALRRSSSRDEQLETL